MVTLLTLLFFLITPGVADDKGISPPSALDPRVHEFLETFESKHIFLNNYMHNHYYKSKSRSDTAVVFLPGMGESALKYYDLAQDLKGDFTFYLWDHIGQGHSYHFIPLESHKVHIDSFDTHIRALVGFLKIVRKEHKNVIVLAHSMGAHIALRALLAQPEIADKMVFSAPLMEINSKWVPIHFIAWLAGYLPADYYPPLHALFKRNAENGSYTTTSKERVEIYKKTWAVFPEIKRSGATLGWVKEAVKSLKDFDDSDLRTIQIPVLMLQAEHDFLVSNPAQEKACKRIPTCKLQTIPESRHELLFENDIPRSKAIQAINAFIGEKVTLTTGK